MIAFLLCFPQLDHFSKYHVRLNSTLTYNKQIYSITSRRPHSDIIRRHVDSFSCAFFGDIRKDDNVAFLCFEPVLRPLDDLPDRLRQHDFLRPPGEDGASRSSISNRSGFSCLLSHFSHILHFVSFLSGCRLSALCPATGH